MLQISISLQPISQNFELVSSQYTHFINEKCNSTLSYFLFTQSVGLAWHNFLQSTPRPSGLLRAHSSLVGQRRECRALGGTNLCRGQQQSNSGNCWYLPNVSAVKHLNSDHLPHRYIFTKIHHLDPDGTCRRTGSIFCWRQQSRRNSCQLCVHNGE